MHVKLAGHLLMAATAFAQTTATTSANDMVDGLAASPMPAICAPQSTSALDAVPAVGAAGDRCQALHCVWPVDRTGHPAPSSGLGGHPLAGPAIPATAGDGLPAQSLAPSRPTIRACTTRDALS